MEKYLTAIDFSTNRHFQSVDTVRTAFTNADQIPGEDGACIRIRVHHDTSYQFQSTAFLDIWTKEGWTEVTRVLAQEVDNKIFGTKEKMGTTETRLFKTAATILHWI